MEVVCQVAAPGKQVKNLAKTIEQGVRLRYTLGPGFENVHLLPKQE
jgi:hypothetical protein